MKRVVGFAVVLALAFGGMAQGMPRRTTDRFIEASWALGSAVTEQNSTFVGGDERDCRKYPNGWRCPLEIRWRPPSQTHNWAGKCSVGVVVWPKGYSFNRRQLAACRESVT